jgi:hypothetical protein
MLSFLFPFFCRRSIKEGAGGGAGSLNPSSRRLSAEYINEHDPKLKYDSSEFTRRFTQNSMPPSPDSRNNSAMPPPKKGVHRSFIQNSRLLLAGPNVQEDADDSDDFMSPPTERRRCASEASGGNAQSSTDNSSAVLKQLQHMQTGQREFERYVVTTLEKIAKRVDHLEKEQDKVENIAENIAGHVAIIESNIVGGPSPQAMSINSTSKKPSAVGQQQPRGGSNPVKVFPSGGVNENSVVEF